MALWSIALILGPHLIWSSNYVIIILDTVEETYHEDVYEMR